MTSATPRIHLSLRATDLQASTTFYTDLFGEGPDKVREGYVRFAPAGVPVLLSLIEGEAGIDHLGLRLPRSASARAEWDRLADAGRSLRPSEGVICCHAAKDEAWLHDPDGHAWEIYAVTDEEPEASPTPSTCCS
ncbi:MAG TPA: glyoxalase/bleomycin resistance/dioxygenase family protein [Deltaproteobacteria bacterium]|nr:glyoxalase/bleomycin resistance/dioxygenase family protein [Deltaproteobacteria bacterium]